jgi:hypothetical protein
MSLKVEPYEAMRLPELPTEDKELSSAIRDLMVAVAGFPYPGATADGIVLALRWMRANPDRAHVLLHRPDDENVVWRDEVWRLRGLLKEAEGRGVDWMVRAVRAERRVHELTDGQEFPIERVPDAAQSAVES